MTHDHPDILVDAGQAPINGGHFLLDAGCRWSSAATRPSRRLIRWSIRSS